MKHFFTPILLALSAMLFASENSSAQSFPWLGTTTTISNSNPFVRTATLSGIGILNSAEGKTPTVVINLTHDYAGDLDISLTSPAGTTIDLSSDNGGSGDNYSVTVFSHGATNSITTGSAPFNGFYSPEESFSAFDGEFGDGVWTLTIVDDASGDDGDYLGGQIVITDKNSFTYMLNDGSISQEVNSFNDLNLPTSGVTWGSNIHNQSNNSLVFDGTNYATASQQAKPLNGVTMAAWIKPSDVNSDQKVIGIADGTDVNDLVSLGVYDGTADFEVREENGSGRISMGNLTNNEWVHIAGTWSLGDNTMRLYVNGELVGSTTGPGALLSFTPSTTTSYYPTFGAAAWNPNSFRYEGAMDDMRCYSRRLSEWEIKDIAANFNQHCQTAVELPVEGNSCSGNYYAHNYAGNGASGPSTSCGGNIGGDSWFTVTVPSSGNVTISSDAVTGSDADDILIEAYSGSCENLTYLNCNDAGGGFSVLPLTGLTPGDVIYVKSWHYNNNNYGEYVICAFDPTLNIDEIENQISMNLYPNPANEFVTIETNLEKTSDVSIVVTNTLGQTIMQSSFENVDNFEHTLNVSNLSSGAYFITVSGENLNQTERLIISE